MTVLADKVIEVEGLMFDEMRETDEEVDEVVKECVLL